MRAGELKARTNDLHKELERTQADLDDVRKRVDVDRTKADTMQQHHQATLARLY